MDSVLGDGWDTYKYIDGTDEFIATCTIIFFYYQNHPIEIVWKQQSCKLSFSAFIMQEDPNGDVLIHPPGSKRSKKN
jgi:hypothetical protein